jgi:hypothetical protein
LLGIIGGILGILAGLLAWAAQSINESLYANPGTSLYFNAAAAFIFSIIGIAGGVLEQRKILGAGLMIIGTFGVFISTCFFGVLTFILFLAGAVIILARRKEIAPATPISMLTSTRALSLLFRGVMNVQFSLAATAHVAADLGKGLWEIRTVDSVCSVIQNLDRESDNAHRFQTNIRLCGPETEPFL